MSDSLDVATEDQTVLLVLLVAQFGQILVDDRVLFTEVNGFHWFNAFMDMMRQRYEKGINFCKV